MFVFFSVCEVSLGIISKMKSSSSMPNNVIDFTVWAQDFFFLMIFFISPAQMTSDAFTNLTSKAIYFCCIFFCFQQHQKLTEEQIRGCCETWFTDYRFSALIVWHIWGSLSITTICWWHTGQREQIQLKTGNNPPSSGILRWSPILIVIFSKKLK